MQTDDLDDLRSAWAAHGALLERSLAIDERLLRETLTGKVRRALTPSLLAWAAQALAGAVSLAVLVPLVAAHGAEPRYAVVGGGLALFLAVLTAASTHLLVRGLQLDLGGPVAGLQREVAGLRLLEWRAFTWALLGGVAAWLPALLFAFEVATGVDALARVDLAWLVANVALGVALLLVGRVLSARHVERPDLTPRARRVVDALSGGGLRRASEQLAELGRFVREEP
jgi:hypothetical protein